MGGSHRVVLVTGQLSHGGSERQLYELAIRLPAHGFEATVVSLSEDEDPYGHLLKDAGVAVHSLPRRRRFELGRVLELSRCLRQLKPDVVHGFLFTGNAYAYLATRLSRGRAFLPAVRNHEPGRKGVLGFVDRLVLSRSRRILVNADYLREIVCGSYGVDESRVRVVPNGLDFSRFEAIATLTAPRKQPAVVGTISLFKKQKRIPFLLDVMHRVHSLRPDAIFRVVGDGPERSSMVDLRDRIGLSDVVDMPGRSDDVARDLAGLDIFVLASDREGMPNVVLEAMASARPVVASDVVGTREVVQHEKTGLVFPADEAETAAQQIVRLLDDPRQAATLGQAGRNVARQQYNVDLMVERTAAVYREFLREEQVGEGRP